jgi:enoyl-CoA hydratase/carnithine racemase
LESASDLAFFSLKRTAAGWSVGSRGNRLATGFQIDRQGHVLIFRLISDDNRNRLTHSFLESMHQALHDLTIEKCPLVITGNDEYFSVGADLNEIAELSGPGAYEFSKSGQMLMNLVAQFPAPVTSAISGFCMGGGLDLALACHQRIADPHATFGHRGAALGLMTGWGGTQRLPRLIGKARALQILAAAETISAGEALRIGLVDRISDDPFADAVRENQGLRLHASPLLL